METFDYHRSLAPTIGVLLGLAVAETIVVHVVVVALWGWRVALVIAALDLGVIWWIVRLLRSLGRLPVTITDGVLTMRFGTLRSIAIPLAQVAGLRKEWDTGWLKRRGVLNLALANWPNVVVELAAPLASGRRRIAAVAHRLDRPECFAAALRAAKGWA